MKLEFAFLADAATVLENGQFDVIGGGFDVVRGKRFPATKYAMTLIGRLLFDQQDFGKRHELTGEILDAGGSIIFPTLQTDFQSEPRPGGKRAPWIALCLNWQGVTFPTPGEYSIRLSVDKDVVGHVVIEAVVEEETT